MVLHETSSVIKFSVNYLALWRWTGNLKVTELQGRSVGHQDLLQEKCNYVVLYKT